MTSDTRFGTWEAAVTWLRDQPERRQLVLDAFYDDPLTAAAERYHASGEWQAVSRLLLGRTGSALDVGAGRGIASYALAREGFAVKAPEPDPSGIVGAAAIRKLAEDTRLSIEVVEEFSERLPFSDFTFDVVFARAVHRFQTSSTVFKRQPRAAHRGKRGPRHNRWALSYARARSSTGRFPFRDNRLRETPSGPACHSDRCR